MEMEIEEIVNGVVGCWLVVVGKSDEDPRWDVVEATQPQSTKNLRISSGRHHLNRSFSHPAGSG